MQLYMNGYINDKSVGSVNPKTTSIDAQITFLVPFLSQGVANVSDFLPMLLQVWVR